VVEGQDLGTRPHNISEVGKVTGILPYFEGPSQIEPNPSCELVSPSHVRMGGHRLKLFNDINPTAQIIPCMPEMSGPESREYGRRDASR
jgi:hypothetical protein